MSLPSITATVSNTGGAIVLNLAVSSGLNPDTTNITINRYSGSLTNPSTTLYSGPSIPVYVDVGDQLPNHLDFNTTYFYSITDTNGTTTTLGILPMAKLVVTSSYLDGMLFRLFTAGIHALDVPAGITKGTEIRVLQELPFSRGEILPCIVMNLDLLQQQEVPIGRAIDTSFTNKFVIPTFALRRYSIWILTRTARDRDFYKDACVSVLLSIMTDVMNTLGQNYTYSFQSAQNQIVDPSPEFAPGFYESNVVMEMLGSYNIEIQTNYGLITHISPTVSATYASGGTGIITQIIIS